MVDSLVSALANNEQESIPIDLDLRSRAVPNISAESELSANFASLLPSCLVLCCDGTLSDGLLPVQPNLLGGAKRTNSKLRTST